MGTARHGKTLKIALAASFVTFCPQPPAEKVSAYFSSAALADGEETTGGESGVDSPETVRGTPSDDSGNTSIAPPSDAPPEAPNTDIQPETTGDKPG
jgi:hypothetical protein